VKYFRAMSTTRPHHLGNHPVVPPPAPDNQAQEQPHRRIGLSRSNQTRRRLRRFVFTLNNYTEEELESIKQFGINSCRWMIVAKETGETGTSHLQGGALLTSQTCFSTLKKLPGFERAHLENMYGKPEDTLLYCSKQDPEPFIVGELPAPGIYKRRTSLPTKQVNVMICTLL